jgi:hypothetical protein
LHAGGAPAGLRLRHHRLSLDDAQADGLSAGRHAVGPYFPAAPGGAGAPELLDAALLLLVVLARGLEIDPEQLGAEHGDHDRRAHGAEHVGHGVGDRHRVDEGLGRVGGQPRPVDGVGRQAHCGGNGLRPRVEPGRIAEIVARHFRDRERNQEAQQALDGREERLRHAIPGDAPHELRADGVADGEQEHEEHRRLERLGDGDPDLPDQHAGQERRGDRPQADALEREPAEVIADAEREEDRDLGVLLQCCEEPVNHDVLPS